MSLASPSHLPMPAPSARRLLLLGGTRSGKSALAETLAADSPAVRYVATATGDHTDPGWSARLRAHRERRPAGWATEEVGDAPGRLADLLATAKPDEVVLVDDLGGWLTAVLRDAGRWDDPAVAEEPVAALTAAVAACQAARLVLVSPEVGLSVVPASEAGRTFTDAHGALNRAVAQACDAVALVVAGLPLWLPASRPDQAQGGPAPQRPAVPEGPAIPVLAPVSAPVAARADLAPAATGQELGVPAELTIGIPDEDNANASQRSLGVLDVPGAGLGRLTEVVRFAAATQRRDDPQPWRQVRVVLLRGDHDGGIAAGDSPSASADRLAAAARGEGPFALLAGAAGASVIGLECPAAGAVEERDALDADAVEVALAQGWRLAEAAVDAGTDLFVLASCGTGAAGAGAAVTALVGGAEAAALLPRVVHPDGRVDDDAWMRRCLAVREALHRVRGRPRDPRTVLATLGGGEVAAAVGLVLGAATRRTPVVVDGPVGAAAALLAREMAIQTARWLLLLDHGGQPVVKAVAGMLGLNPLTDLHLDLGEGCTALAALPMLQSLLAVAATAWAAPPPESQPAAQPAAQPAEPPAAPPDSSASAGDG